MMIALLITAVLTWSPEAVLKEYLTENYPWPEIQVEKVIPEKEFPGTRPSRISTLRGPLGRSEFIFSFPDGSSIRVKAKVTARDRVVKTIRSLTRHTLLDRSMLYTTLMDVRRIPRGAVRTVQAVTGKELKRSVRADMVLREGMVKNQPVIRRGDRVTIIYQSPSLRITVPGMARTSGSVGEGVEVLNLRSKKLVIGMVSGKGVVDVSSR